MIETTLSGRIVLDVPDGSDVSSDGSIFGPDGLDLAVYVENPEETPRTDAEFRKEIIEGRSYVEEFTSEQVLPDGWMIRFRSENGLGFERGRILGDLRLVFWADRLPSETAVSTALAICASAALA